MNDKTNASDSDHRSVSQLNFCVHKDTYVFLETVLTAGCHHMLNVVATVVIK